MRIFWLLGCSRSLFLSHWFTRTTLTRCVLCNSTEFKRFTELTIVLVDDSFHFSTFFDTAKNCFLLRKREARVSSCWSFLCLVCKCPVDRDYEEKEESCEDSCETECLFHIYKRDNYFLLVYRFFSVCKFFSYWLLFCLFFISSDFLKYSTFLPEGVYFQ